MADENKQKQIEIYKKKWNRWDRSASVAGAVICMGFLYAIISWAGILDNPESKLKNYERAEQSLIILSNQREQLNRQEESKLVDSINESINQTEKYLAQLEKNPEYRKEEKDRTMKGIIGLLVHSTVGLGYGWLSSSRKKYYEEKIKGIRI